MEQQNIFYYPDVMLTCQPDDDHPYYKRFPCLQIGVFSPSNAAIDRREKWFAYRTLESRRANLLVYAEQCHIHYYLRNGNGVWTVGQLETDEVLTIDHRALRMPSTFNDMYEDSAP